MITVFKIITGRATGSQFFNVESMGGQTRGHQFKLKKSHARTNDRCHRFPQRVINDWNGLPAHIVNSVSTTAFKKALDEHWTSMKYKSDQSEA